MFSNWYILHIHIIENQALPLKMGFWVIIILNNIVSLAFIWYTATVLGHTSLKLCVSENYCKKFMQIHWTLKKAVKSWNFTEYKTILKSFLPNTHL